MNIISFIKESAFRYTLLQSLFIENNTPDHYHAIIQLLNDLLVIDIQNALPLLLQIIFSSQLIVVQKLVYMNTDSLLLQYIDSTTIHNPPVLKMITPSSISTSSQGYFISGLDTVCEGEEEEEEEEDNENEIENEQRFETPSGLNADSKNEIPLFPSEMQLSVSFENPSTVDEILLTDEKEEQSPYVVPRPEGIHYEVLLFHIHILTIIAEVLNSEELKLYLLNVFLQF